MFYTAKCFRVISIYVNPWEINQIFWSFLLIILPVKISIKKFPAVSNFNEFDALTRNIYLGSLKVCKT
jgi:hypothetical protein